jgi:hypothetical protein
MRPVPSFVLAVLGLAVTGCSYLTPTDLASYKPYEIELQLARTPHPAVTVVLGSCQEINHDVVVTANGHTLKALSFGDALDAEDLTIPTPSGNQGCARPTWKGELDDAELEAKSLLVEIADDSARFVIELSNPFLDRTPTINGQPIEKLVRGQEVTLEGVPTDTLEYGPTVGLKHEGGGALHEMPVETGKGFIRFTVPENVPPSPYSLQLRTISRPELLQCTGAPCNVAFPLPDVPVEVVAP